MSVTNPTRLEAAFEKFHAKNPLVWSWFCHFARKCIDAGVPRIGGKFIMVRVRWECLFDKTAMPFKVNNTYTAYYVRKYCRVYPEHAHLFKTRKIKGEF